MELTKTGQWLWREDELSYKNFTLLPKDEKEEYLFLLKGLKPEELSTTDLIILNRFNFDKPKEENFYSL